MKTLRRRPEPKVAEHNKQRAIANINCKITILQGWISNGIPIVQVQPDETGAQASSPVSLEYFPKSNRQFNAWDGSQNSKDLNALLPKISRNANDTLRKNANLRTKVEQIVESLRLRAADQCQDAKPARISKLRSALKVEKRIRALLENELIEVRRALKAEQSAHKSKTQKAENQSKEFREYVLRLTSENQRLAEENAALIKKLAKISPIRKT